MRLLAVQCISGPAAGEQTDGVQRRERRRADGTLQPEAEGPEGEGVEQQVRQVGMDEPARNQRGVLAAAHEVIGPQQVALDQRGARVEAEQADDDDG